MIVFVLAQHFQPEGVRCEGEGAKQGRRMRALVHVGKWVLSCADGSSREGGRDWLMCDYWAFRGLLRWKDVCLCVFLFLLL